MSYEKIAGRLAASDPKNIQWQTDLVFSWVKVAGVCGEPLHAKNYYQQALTLLKTLKQKSLLTAEQAGWINTIEQLND